MVKIRSTVRSLLDGVVFQAAMVGALSFGHIHDLVIRYGQTGWKGWLYPPSVDLLVIAAYQKIEEARADGRRALLAWFAFVLGLTASLAANVLDAWITSRGSTLAVIIGSWPAAAFAVSTTLRHTRKAEQKTEEIVEQEMEEPEAVAAVAVSAGAVPATRPADLPTAEIKSTKGVRAFLKEHPGLASMNQSALHRKIEELCAVAQVEAPSPSTVRRAVTTS